MQVIKLVGVVGIPVGHRVQVTWFSRSVQGGGWFSAAESRTERIAIPQVTDLQTGIVYAHRDFACAPESFTRLDQINVTALGVRDELSVAEELTGVVRACQVTVFSNEHAETWLEVEPAP